MIIDVDNPWVLLPTLLTRNPDAVAALPVFLPSDPESTLVLKAQQKTRRLPPDLAAHIARSQAAASGGSSQVELPTHLVVGRVLLTVPADLAENLRGPVEDRHPIWLVVVKRECYDDVVRQARSGIVLPDAKTIQGIIKP